ncbi:hypothetical protein ACUXOX_003307 [Klebsiella quasipneumoniae]
MIDENIIKQEQEPVFNKSHMMLPSNADFFRATNFSNKNLRQLEYASNIQDYICIKHHVFKTSYGDNDDETSTTIKYKDVVYKNSNFINDKLNVETNLKNEESLLADDTAILFNYLKNETFTPGYLSSADRFFEDKFKSSSMIYINALLNKVSMLCYVQYKNYSYLHFLNLLKNATFYMEYDDLKMYAVLSVAKNDCEIKDLAMSLFESFNYKNSASLKDAIACLDHIDTTSYPWLTEYKEEIISELKEELGEY